MDKINNILLKAEVLDKRELELRNRESALAKKVETSNKTFESLWNGYDLLNILKPNHSELSPIDRRNYEKKLSIIEKKYSVSVEALTKMNCTEECLADFLTLSTSRWNTIQSLKKTWSNRRAEFRKKQLEIIKKLESNSALKMETDSNLIIDNLAEQEKLFTVEEEVTNEQFDIYEFRENLLIVAGEIFMKE